MQNSGFASGTMVSLDQVVVYVVSYRLTLLVQNTESKNFFSKLTAGIKVQCAVHYLITGKKILSHEVPFHHLNF